MNPSKESSHSPQQSSGSQPMLASEAWHRLVTCICLLACIGIVVMGIARLLDPTEGRAVPAKPIDYLAGVSFIMLGFLGICYLVRQLRTSDSSSSSRQ